MMTEKGLDVAKAKIASLKRIREIRSQGTASIRSLEIVMASGVVCVFSNEQPAADFPIGELLGTMLDEVAQDALAQYEQAILYELKEMGVDPDAPDETEAKTVPASDLEE